MNYIIYLLIFFLVSCATNSTSQKYPEKTFFDVGNGTCSVIICNSESAILYDCGYNKKGTNKSDFISKINNDILERELKIILGFITLSSQPDNDGSKSIVRDDKDQILRKPLK